MANQAKSNKVKIPDLNDLKLSLDLSELEFQIKTPGLSRDSITSAESRTFKGQILVLAKLLSKGEVIPVSKAHGRITLVPRRLVERARREQTKELENINRPDRCLLTKDSVIIASHSTNIFASKIARSLGADVDNYCVAQTRKFSDGEPIIEINRSIKLKNARAIIIPNTREPVEKNVLELLFTVQAVVEAGAKSVTVVLPYYPFGRADRPEKHSHTSVGAEAFAMLLKQAARKTKMNTDISLITMDPHSLRPITPYFVRDKELLVLYAYNLVSPVLKAGLKRAKVDFNNLMIISPDRGGLPRVMYYSSQYRVPAGWLNKHRDRPNHIDEITGPYVAEWEENGQRGHASRKPLNVKGKDILLVDDMFDTVGTLLKACKRLKAAGAERIFVLGTHAVLSGPGYRRLMVAISEGLIEKVFTTDTVPWKNGYPKTSGVEIINVSSYFAEAIRRHNRKGSSIDALHNPNWRRHAKVA